MNCRDESTAAILRAKAGSTVALFDRGEYYQAFAVDSELIAKEILRNAALLKNVVLSDAEKTSVNYVTLNHNQFNHVVRELLLRLQQRVEVYEQAPGKCWQLVTKGSPGNLADFEDVIEEAREGDTQSGVLAVRLRATDSTLVSMAFCDTRTFELSVAEFADGAQLATLETSVVQLSPSECLVCCNDAVAADSLKRVLSRAGVLITEQKKSCFTATDIVQDLNRLLYRKDTSCGVEHLAELSERGPMECVAALIKYLSLLSDPTNSARFHLRRFNARRFVRLDCAAARALELFSTNYGCSKAPVDCLHACVTHSARTSKGSLYALLNRCTSTAGQRLLDRWMRQPLVDVREIEERLDVVDALVSDCVTRSTLRTDLLARVPDLQRLSKRLARKKATLQDCYKLYQLVRVLPRLIRELSTLSSNGVGAASIKEMLLEPLEHARQCFIKFVEMLDSTLDLAYLEKTANFRVKPEFDKNLKLWQREYRRAAVRYLKAARVLNLEASKTIKLETAADDVGFYFRITRKEEKALRNKKGFNVIDAKSSGVRFSNGDLAELNEGFIELRRQYEQTQKDIIDHILEIAVGYMEPMQRLSDVLAALDVLAAFAEAADSAPAPFVRPRLLARGAGVLRLDGARHPCLEADVSFIANDVTLRRDEREVLIVTGPNMGGKSTFLRQTAVIVLMAQMGCFVPCASAELSPVDAVFARVGASDCEARGVSTFMAEMLETALILDAATADSLVIVDELGRGTSTYDGFGIAFAVAEHLAKNVHCFCLFATHFHEMAQLADEVPTVSNVHVTAEMNNGRLLLKYKVQTGQCDQSFGINVAEMVNLPEDIIKCAWKLLKELESA